MPNFIRTRGRHSFLVNLDHVARVKMLDRDVCALLDKDGNTLGEIDDDDDLALDESIIPAAAGSYATIIGCYTASTYERPTEDDLLVERVQIIAWSINVVSGMRYRAMPIIAGLPSDNDHTFLERPDGKLEETYLGVFDNIDDAKAYVLRDAQNDWDRDKRLREEKAASSSQPAKSTE